jgi:hypothetical protein
MTIAELKALAASAGAQGTQIGLVNMGALLNTLVALVAALAPEYDKTATYAKDALVIYDGELYAAKAAINTAEVWTAAHWEKRTIAAAIAKKADS